MSLRTAVMCTFAILVFAVFGSTPAAERDPVSICDGPTPGTACVVPATPESPAYVVDEAGNTTPVSDAQYRMLIGR